MSFRIYIDESGTHSTEWLVIGVLFVPDHGKLHSELCAAKDQIEYFNKSPKSNAKYKEIHMTTFRSNRDVQTAKAWLDAFMTNTCYYRCVVIDWSIWDGKYFGGPFEPESLKKRRAYKKWLEMLIHPELKQPTSGVPIVNAKLYLDRLRILLGYDVVPELEERFTRNYRGESPYIQSFQHTDSKADANQCLQLCDLLTGCVYQGLVPSMSPEKLAVRDYLCQILQPHKVKSLSPSFWKGYAATTLNRNFPKFSEWFWRPS